MERVVVIVAWLVEELFCGVLAPELAHGVVHRDVLLWPRSLLLDGVGALSELRAIAATPSMRCAGLSFCFWICVLGVCLCLGDSWLFVGFLKTVACHFVLPAQYKKGQSGLAVLPLVG